MSSPLEFAPIFAAMGTTSAPLLDELRPDHLTVLHELESRISGTADLAALPEFVRRGRAALVLRPAGLRPFLAKRLHPFESQERAGKAWANGHFDR
ncbi:MAG: hypothetical protein ACOCTG_06625, partial [Bacteroidota bacterium]